MPTDRLNPNHVPRRLSVSGYAHFLLYVILAVLFVWANRKVQMSPAGIADGLPSLMRLFGEMVPPDFSRAGRLSEALLETLLMAVVGTVYGITIAFVLAVQAARHLSAHPLIYYAARGLIAFFRTVPDLIWAVIFVVTVGLGPLAGTLTIAVDTIGFCGRFFAEAMEETDRGPQDALAAIGATRAGIIYSTVVPAALPSFVNTSLFSLEKAVRSSVVLGLVGAGGIGIELKVAMDLFEYRQALTIIMMVFLMVLAVEQISARIRARLF